MYIIYASLIGLLFLFWIVKKRIILGIWSIKVFKSNTMISNPLDEGKFLMPTLQASDVLDVRAEFVADPFIISHEYKLYMFFEILDKSTGKGIIGVASSVNGDSWNYEKAVLKESFHLSYPYVFKHKDEYFMIPESSEANKVLLYKAKTFPYEWEIASELLHGKYVDSSIFKYNNKWWMFAAKSGRLHLFHSDELEKNWVEHPMSPLITNDNRITRPGGRVILEKEYIYRYTQDGKPNYGSAVRVFKITQLSEEEYQEEEVGLVLNGSKKEMKWNKDGMHSIDQLKMAENQWLIAVDGHTLRNKQYLLWKVDRLFSKLYMRLKGVNNSILTRDG